MKKAYQRPCISTMMLEEEEIMTTSFAVDKGTEIDENLSRRHRISWNEDEEEY